MEPLARWPSFSAAAAHVLGIWGSGKARTGPSPPPAPTTLRRTHDRDPCMGSPEAPVASMRHAHSRTNHTQPPSTVGRGGVSGRQEQGMSEGTSRPAPAAPATRVTSKRTAAPSMPHTASQTSPPHPFSTGRRGGVSGQERSTSERSRRPCLLSPAAGTTGKPIHTASMPHTPFRTNPTQPLPTACHGGVSGRHDRGMSKGRCQPSPSAPTTLTTGDCTTPTPADMSRISHIGPVTPAVAHVRALVRPTAGKNGVGQGPRGMVSGRSAGVSGSGLAVKDADGRDVRHSRAPRARTEVGGRATCGGRPAGCSSAGERDVMRVAVSLDQQCTVSVQMSSSACWVKKSRV